MLKEWIIAAWLAALVTLTAAPGSPVRGHSATALSSTAAPVLPYPILFVTQVPIPADFTTIASTFGNHDGQINSAPRGGDLWLRYPDGTTKNLTRAAGYGMDGMQGASAIAVRDPAVDWSGTKALLSMVIGAPEQYQWNEYRWQIYEMTGLEEGSTPVIAKVAKQPAGYNNVSPFYGTDGRILFSSDRPRNGEPQLYPQLDQYEEAPTTTGLWSLDPASGDLRMLNHSPSGVFSPSIDSFGRIIFTRWDHLQRDQQADTDETEGGSYGTFDYADETASSQRLDQRVEIFPEPRSSRTDLLAGTNLEGNSVNHFFPWTIDEVGTGEETLNHVGRHELHGYFDKTFNDDPFIIEFISVNSGRLNQNVIENVLQMKEDPTRPGVYFGTDAPEFYTHAAGQIISLTAEPTRTADKIIVDYVTARSTETFPDSNPPTDDSGHYRDPLPLSDGSLLVVHTAETRRDVNDGTRPLPQSRYDFRIKTTKKTGDVMVADQPITPGIHASVSYWDPDELVTWEGNLWELTPVEVRPRAIPQPRVETLDTPEATIFQQEGVDPQRFKDYLTANGLAVMVSRDVTQRDDADRQQPFNLRVPGGTASHVTDNGKTYDVAHMQLFEADQVRGLGGTADPRAGRRVLARLLHDPAVHNPATNGPVSSVRIAADGSVAAFVPAHRAMSWQTTGSSGTPVVRERYWVSFQPGEVRVCTSCHGVKSHDQLGMRPAQNSPEALRLLLQFWKSEQQSDPRRRAVKR